MPVHQRPHVIERCDCCSMRWIDFDPAGKRILVVQEKTGTKVWVPAHIRLRNYLANLPHENEFILTSQKAMHIARPR